MELRTKGIFLALKKRKYTSKKQSKERIKITCKFVEKTKKMQTHHPIWKHWAICLLKNFLWTIFTHFYWKDAEKSFKNQLTAEKSEPIFQNKRKQLWADLLFSVIYLEKATLTTDASKTAKDGVLSQKGHFITYTIQRLSQVKRK